MLIVLSESEIKSTCVHPIRDVDSYSVAPLVNTLMLHLESECASYLQHNYKSRDGAEGTQEEVLCRDTVGMCRSGCWKRFEDLLLQ